VELVPVPTVDLVIGLDLGTSCSKVVIGDPSWKDKAYAVSLHGAGQSLSDFLSPTRLAGESNLKMRLMDDPSSIQNRDLVACYLAKVLQDSCAWFLQKAPPDYRRRDLRWSLNLGYPGKSIGSTALADAYRQVAKTASALAALPDHPSLETAAKVRCGEVTPVPLTGNRIELYPEIAAQLAGYVSSPYRHRGNILLIDIGAGTLDVSTLILHGDNERDVVSFHVCEVVQLGVLRLLEKRLMALQSIDPSCVRCSLAEFQGGTRATPEKLMELVPHPSPELATAFSRTSEEFSLEMMSVALRCLVRFRQRQRATHRNPGFDPWGPTLRFFLTGGGCRSPFYRSQLAEGPLEARLAANYTRWETEAARRRSLGQGLRLDSFPVPPRLLSFPSVLRADFDRLSVAYGLALGGGPDGDSGNLMKITNCAD
jgi:hypothetical protein